MTDSINIDSQPDGHPLEVRIDNALMIADIYGQTPGNDNRAWVIDQMVRALTGCKYEIINGRALDIREVKTSREYYEWVEFHCDMGYEWDTGVKP